MAGIGGRRLALCGAAFVSCVSMVGASEFEAELLARVKKRPPRQTSGVGDDPYAQRVKADQARVIRLLTADKLKTGKEFEAAAKAFSGLPMHFNDQHVIYELRLTAALLGNEASIAELPRTWDFLLGAMGFNQRFGSVTQGQLGAEDRFPRRDSPQVIRDAWKDLGAFRERAAAAMDSEELKTLAEADQADRRQSWTAENFDEIVKRDAERKKRTLAIFDQGGIASANDLFRAGLMVQHGSSVYDFALAHECGVLLALLKNPAGPSLCSVSYDRMLLHAGHNQRFGTQLGFLAHHIDQVGISDTQRRVLAAIQNW